MINSYQRTGCLTSDFLLPRSGRSACKRKTLAPCERRGGHERDGTILSGKASERTISTFMRGPQSPSRVAAGITAENAPGRLREGDRIPTEMVVSTHFGGTRAGVRGASARLRSVGV